MNDPYVLKIINGSLWAMIAILSFIIFIKNDEIAALKNEIFELQRSEAACHLSITAPEFYE